MTRGAGARGRRSAGRSVEAGVDMVGVSKAHDADLTETTATLAALAAGGDVGDIVAVEVNQTNEFGGDTVEVRHGVFTVDPFAAIQEWAADEALAAIGAFAQGACMDCGHMADQHMNGGVCSVPTCSCEMYAAPDDGYTADEVEYAEVEEGELAVVAFVPSDQAVEDALGALTVDSPEAADIVRLRLDELVSSRFQDQPVVITPPIADDDPFTMEWEAILAPEGTPTSDGRAFAPGAIRWRELPLSLSAMVKTAEGHDGAKVCGRIDTIWRDEAAGLIRAKGEFDNSDWGQEVARMVAERILTGNSVDLAIHDVEYVPRSRYFDADGNWAPTGDDSPVEFDPFDDTPGEPMIFLIKDAEIGMSTVCPFPAFAEAKIESGRSRTAGGAPNPWLVTVTQDAGYRLTKRSLTAAIEIDLHIEIETPEEELAEIAADAAEEAAGVQAGVQASAVAVRNQDGDVIGYFQAKDGEWTRARYLAASAPVCPPAEWFMQPTFDGPHPLTVDDDGRIYGHAATWGSCHTGFPNVCVTPPHSTTDYRLFHLKQVQTADGDMVDVGTITLRAPHANQALGLRDASAHYDHTGMAAADIRVGEDEHGIWVAGAARSTLDDESLRELRGATLSGDWRDYQGNLEMIALLAVNVPGFPVPRVRARVAGGHMQSLVAAGIHSFEAQTVQPAVEVQTHDEPPDGLDDFQVQVLKALAARDLHELAAG